MFDIGANLTHSSFSLDRTQVLRQAQLANVSHIVITAATLEDSIAAVEVVRTCQGEIKLFATCGFHPHNARLYQHECYDKLFAQCNLPEVVAVGESGLDYYRNYSSAPAQQTCFADHLQLASETQLPLFLHQREAHARFYAMLREYRDAVGNVVVHCFTGTKKELFAYLDLDCYIGITGWICDPRRGAHLCSLVGEIPQKRLLVETDSPYLLPPECRNSAGKNRNEPRFLPAVLSKVAACRHGDESQLAEQTVRNACAFFSVEHHET